MAPTRADHTRFMSPQLTTTRPRNTARTIAALERLVADSTAAPKMRRAATLRLGRLRAASRPAITTRTTAPAPAPSEKAIFEAVQSFHALSRQRSALFRKRRSGAEQSIFAALNLLMPAAAPTNDDPKAWSDFIGRIDLLLEEIRSAKPL